MRVGSVREVGTNDTRNGLIWLPPGSSAVLNHKNGDAVGPRARSDCAYGPVVPMRPCYRLAVVHVSFGVSQDDLDRLHGFSEQVQQLDGEPDRVDGDAARDGRLFVDHQRDSHQRVQ